VNRMIRSTAAAGGLLIAAVTFVAVGVAQDGEDPKKPFEEKFWSYLQKADYAEKFSPWPGMEDDYYPGRAPHGAHLKMYVNRPVTENPSDPPHKSVIVKENYNEAKELAAITVMYRSKDYDPDNNDWYWVKYQPDGTVAKMKDMKLAGKVDGCIQCHSSAKGGDYVFANDE